MRPRFSDSVAFEVGVQDTALGLMGDGVSGFALGLALGKWQSQD